MIDRETFENLARAGLYALPYNAARSARIAGAVPIPPPDKVPALGAWASAMTKSVEALVNRYPRKQKAADGATMARAHIAAELKGDITEANRLIAAMVDAEGGKPAATRSNAADFYLEASDDEVPIAVLVRAQLTMLYALEALSMEAPALRWFRPESEAEKADRTKAQKEGRTVERAPVPANSWGVARYISNEIWLAADIPLEEVDFTMAHECAHIYQMQQIPHLRIKAKVSATEREWMEWDADAFAYRFVARKAG